MNKLKELMEKIKKMLYPVKPRDVTLSDMVEDVFETIAEIDEWAYPIDFFEGPDGKYAIVASNAKLYRVPFSVNINSGEVKLGEWQEVEQKFEPVTESRKLLLSRQSDGKTRCFMIASTTVLNRVGEIDSKELHDTLNRTAAETGKYPYVDFFHLGETWTLGQVDFLARDENIAIASFVFNEGWLADLMIRSIQENPQYWGASISFYSESPEMVEIVSGIKIPVYRSGAYQSITILPEKSAAAWFTTLTKPMEVNRMKKQILDALKVLAGEDEETAKALEELVDATNKEINERGLITRENDETPQAENSAPVAETEQTENPLAPEKTEPVETELVIDESVISRIAEVVTQAITANVIVPLTNRIEAMHGQIQSLDNELRGMRQANENNRSQIDARIAKLEKPKDEAVEDAPAVTNRTKVIYRPRSVNAQPVQQVEAGYSEVAESTLANIK